MTMAERLLWLAEKLANEGTHSLTLKRRAVSTAYYGVFHALASLCADSILTGADRLDRQSTEYERVYRALDHGPLRTAFSNEPLKGSAIYREIGDLVVRLQSERHRSDYLPTRRLYTSAECSLLIDSAKTAVRLLNKLDASQRKVLAICLLLKNRTS
jgi:uncharacterized protein (UPF0332 family)